MHIKRTKEYQNDAVSKLGVYVDTLLSFQVVLCILILICCDLRLDDFSLIHVFVLFAFAAPMLAKLMSRYHNNF